MQRIARWWTRPAKHHEFLIALETDPMFWGMVVAGTVLLVFSVIPYTLHMHMVG